MCTALDGLIIELQQLPRVRQQAVRRWQRVEQTLPTLDFVVGRLARVWFGTDLYAAIERLQTATNNLLPVAPEPLLRSLDPIFRRFETFADRGDNWLEELRAERAVLFEIARSVAEGDLEPVKEKSPLRRRACILAVSAYRGTG